MCLVSMEKTSDESHPDLDEQVTVRKKDVKDEWLD